MEWPQLHLVHRSIFPVTEGAQEEKKPTNILLSAISAHLLINSNLEFSKLFGSQQILLLKLPPQIMATAWHILPKKSTTMKAVQLLSSLISTLSALKSRFFHLFMDRKETCSSVFYQWVSMHTIELSLITVDSLRSSPIRAKRGIELPRQTSSREDPCLHKTTLRMAPSLALYQITQLY